MSTLPRQSDGFSSEVSQRSSYDTAPDDDDKDKTDNVEEAAKKLSQVALNQNRYLNESSHNYERYSLPATRHPSYDASTKSGSQSPEINKAILDSLEQHSMGKGSQKRPSAMFLSVAGGGGRSSDKSSGESSPTETNNNGMFYLANSHENIGGSSGVSPNLSRNSSPQSPSVSAFPSADPDDPYARKYRPPPVQNISDIAPRFVFKKTSGKSSTSLKSLNPTCSTSSQKRSSSRQRSEKSSKALGQLNNHNNRGSDSEDGSLSKKKSKPHGSMMELKRFFKLKHHHKSPKSSSASTKSHESSSSTLRSSQSNVNLPFMEDGFKKYGKIGRVLGSGAGGSVRLMKRSSDNTVFAVKEFREKHINESERDYSKKVTAEFCIGSTLHHPNVIETLDIIKDGGRYYEVMEYCPYDFFAIVMSGKMSRAEVGCAFRQILSGVQYLHEMGLAHRDLKLDNCVVTEQGILKLIDFGSASVFRYPFEEDIVMAKGVVGSDPYLAPEVLSEPRYDPRPADLWSVAVIFCCMTLRRFPWKAPKMSDNSFRLFATEPDEGVDQTKLTSSADIKGSWRLLRLLAQPSRHIIGRMLDLNPSSRATIEDILSDEWVQSLEFCTLDKAGGLIKGADHEHTFVPAEQAHLESYKKDKEKEKQ